ncbi:MAG: Crp/Fnr family transcriptional regulator [Dongiaceae bacterium]
MIPMTSNVEFAGRAFRPAKLSTASTASKPASTDHAFDFCIGGAGTRQVRTLKPGENLFIQGDDVRSICVLHAGWAFRYQCLEDGRRQIVDFVLPGDVLGVDSSTHAPYGVEALSPCSWVIISREAFFADLRRQPALSMKLVDLLSAAQLRAFEQMTSVGRRTARERVAYLLLDLARRVRKSASACEGVEITMPLMLSHIGDALGLATETVCRCLGELKRAGILVFSAGRLEILDIDGLSDLAGSLIENDDETIGNRRALVA